MFDWIDWGMLIVWAGVFVAFVWNLSMLCVQIGRYMELQARQEFADKRRNGFQ
jgi:hypothetical protein